MYTKLTGEFDCIEFAEAAAKMIRDSIIGEKKIVLYKNKSKYRGCAESITDNSVANGNSVLIYPFSTHSNSFISGLVSRSADESQINELLRTESVKMEVICLENASDKAAQYMLSCGGYDLKS